MREYVNSKITGYSLILDWMEDEISAFQTRNDHTPIINFLKNKLLELKQSLSRLKAIFSIGDDRLLRRASLIIHQIEYEIYILSYYYIPGLKREEKSDLFFRSLLLSNVGRWGLSWIKDILVRLDGSHATFPVFTEIPIIFAPPQQAATLLDMASIYHEIGHNVFQHFKEIGDELSKAISEYFSRLKKEVGPMSPMKQAEYEKNIEDAANYWAIERLSEIFSDIYATYICGPAYYFSCVDMAMKMGGNPFDVNMADVHPPASARVNACYKTLLSEHQIGDTTTLVQNMQNIWNNYINTYQRTSHFELRCGDTIIDLLVKKSIQEIQHLLPNAYHYLEKINLLQSKMITSSDSLEIILNKALEIFLKEPQYYPEWEKSAFRVLHVQNDERTR